MKTVWFVRHAEPNTENHIDRERELTPKGLENAKLVTAFLKKRPISLLLSSPYRRSIQTVQGFSMASGLPIEIVNDFRERKVGQGWIENFPLFAQRQWEDFSYCLPGGECLMEVQARNVKALEEVFRRYPQREGIAIGSHGTALSMVVCKYQPAFGYQDFIRLSKMPWVVEFRFEAGDCQRIISHDLFTGTQEQIL